MGQTEWRLDTHEEIGEGKEGERLMADPIKVR